MVRSSVPIRCDAVLFDLDGVLVDSRAPLERAWVRWAARHRLDPAVVLGEAHGRRTVDAIGAIAPWLDPESETDTLEHAQSRDADGLVALPGVHSLLRMLPVGSWAIVTSCTQRLAASRLAHAGIASPDVLVTADDVRRGKPAPEPYLVAASALAVEPRRCLVVEDSPSGVAAGKSAGAVVLALATTSPVPELAVADYVASSLASLTLRSATRSATRSGERPGLELVLEP